MSLAVDVWTVGDDGESHVLDVPPGVSDLAGFESCRTGLWGSPAVRSLGAVFLPRLAHGDLWVANEDVAAFAAECDLVRAHSAALAEATPYDDDYIRARLTNILAAASRATRLGGGVVVW
ncbi:hypothetical protein [Actinoplanes sp. NPDC023714]|uniref:hypothetical protein n=1 Tax=Actinoplanes sp. NPDC023714 TaxID=3154322 RepID=UPI0033F30A1C